MAQGIGKSRICELSARGFTLIELLVVISIIALLVSILLPSLGKARDLAARAGCMAALGSVGKGWAIYRDSNDGKIPYVDDDGNLFEIMPPLVTDNTDSTIMKSMEDAVERNNWKCPSQNGAKYFDLYGTSYNYFFYYMELLAGMFNVGLDQDAVATKAMTLSDEHAVATPVFMDAYDETIGISHPINQRNVQSGVVMYWDTHVEFCEGDIAEKLQSEQGFIELLEEITGVKLD